MDPNNVDANEFSVNEGAFWHTKMDLYYGYQLGEVVEVEHESNKYWLATIEYSFKHLILLKWVGNYGEFWVDTSMQNNSTTSLSAMFIDQFNTPKRLFPPGYHLQSQLKSQFILERPSKVLVKPSLYNPANDPYADVKTVDDLLALEVNQNTNDAFGNQSSSNNSEPASVVLAKCKTKIAYSQEDVDELDAALQNLNELDTDQQSSRNESPDTFNLASTTTMKITTTTATNLGQSPVVADDTKTNVLASVESQQDNKQQQSLDLATSPVQSKSSNNEEKTTDQPSETCEAFSQEKRQQQSKELKKEPLDCNEKTESGVENPIVENYEVECVALQNMAVNSGKYFGFGENNKKEFHMKPKQFFDIGGANQEKVLVPGTILEICYNVEGDNGLELYYWFAIVLKNVGGRLTLRWFFCDEPKFKQGRLELKSCRSEFIREEEDMEESGDTNKDGNKCGLVQTKSRLPAKDITFCMHFCNPCVHSIAHDKSIQRAYKLPTKILSFIEETREIEDVKSIEQNQIGYIFDFRRMALDKDRPIINHLLSTVYSTRPSYVNISFAPKDKHNRREVLLSTPKTTKLLRGFIKREISPGVYEVHSEPTSENGEVIKFIYPYDSSYSILPTNWAVNNEDCLSVQASRNPTPIPHTDKSTLDEGNQIKTLVSSDHDSGLDNIDSVELEKASLDMDIDDDSVIDRVINIITNRHYVYKMTEDGVTETTPCSIGIGEGSGSQLKEECGDLDSSTLAETLISSQPMQVEIKQKSESQAQDESQTGPSEPDDDTSSTFECSLDSSQMNEMLTKFRVMDQLEVVHPSSDVTICMGRIRKVVYPLLWIQISADSYTLLPFNSTDIYPTKWCDTYNHQLISLLPPRKRLAPTSTSQLDKKRKKTTKDEALGHQVEIDSQRVAYEKEHFDLGALTDKQLDLDYILNEKSMYIRIYFNHKCFTGPSLSKGKICSLPQYVGPGPLRLVIEEVVTKVISVAYVPPRILNDLSSKSFEDLLIARNLTNTAPMEFKAKYQKRVHREDIPVCLSPDDVALYCECVCEHLKCCYNLFGPNLYDGDDCPGHCRALTKSNKFMKRATYYREKARLGEFLNTNDTTNNGNNANNNGINNGGSNSNSNSNSNAVVSSSADVVEEDDKNSYKKPAHHWTVEDVADHLEKSQLGKFKGLIVSEGVDGQALLLLDKAAIREHFQLHQKTEYTSDEMAKLCHFVESAKSRLGAGAGI